MATSALVCINLKTRGKGEVGEGDTRQLVQALVDQGIIQLDHKTTIRVIDNKPSRDLDAKPSLSFTAPSHDNSSGCAAGGSILVEGGGSESKLVIQNRPILVGRSLLGGGSAGGVLHLVSSASQPAQKQDSDNKVQLVHVTAARRVVETKCQSEPQPPAPPPATTTSDGEPIKLPENLESLPRADHFPPQRHRWNTNEEIAAILITFERHMDWQSKEVKIRPKSGSMLLYSRKKVRYRRDGYCWKKRKDGKTTREDHMKLKVQGTECIYGCYVHSAILPTFHRRCYWLLQNPDIVLVHYLNVPYPDDNKLVSPTLSLCADKKQWTKEELVSQLKPMFYSEDEPEFNNELEISTAETVETIVSQLLERQRSARASAICKQLECGCPDSTCTDAKTCAQPMRRIQAVKTEPSPPDSNQVSSTTGSVLLSGGSGSSGAGSGRQVMESGRHLHISALHHQATHLLSQGSGSGSTPLVLNLSQIQPGGLLILNPQQGSSQPPHLVQRQTRTGSAHHMPSTHKESMLPNPRTIVHQQGGVEGVGGEMRAEKEGESQKGTGQAVPSAPANLYQSLELTHDDIQQTLSANMPHHTRNNMSSSKQSNVLSGLEEIDFIDVNAIPHDDDVLVNLDAFDMLSEFPELDPLAVDQNHNNGNGGCEGVGGNDNGGGEVMETEKEGSGSGGGSSSMDYREGTANITDFSPEWAYTQGGVKVLVTGPWYSTTSPYSVLFDSVPVPTTLVQSGVLRCFCPAHEAGFVTVRVACEGFVISNSVMFEYKREGEGECVEGGRDAWPPDSLLRFSLSHRLDSLAHRVDIKQEPLDLVEGGSGGGSLEEKLVRRVEELSCAKWKEQASEPPPLDWCHTYNNMSLLHLASLLGFTRFVCALVHWRNYNPSPLLEHEVNPLGHDSDGFTPLMRAVVRGRLETSTVLCEWEPGCLALPDREGRSLSEVASQFGQSALANHLLSTFNQGLSSGGALSAEEDQRIVPSGLMARHSEQTDSLFLHPTQMHRNGSSLELHVNIPGSLDKNSRHSSPSPTIDMSQVVGERLSKRPSVDSGIHLQSSLDSLSSLRSTKLKPSPIHKLSRFDRSMSLPVSSPLEECFDPSLDSIRPSRRMELTLCDGEPTASSSPPADLSASLLSLVGEQDAKVLTLAEQIIAAMPERIKNESDVESMTMGSEDMDAVSLESPLLLEDHPSSSSSCCFDSSDFNFDQSYRYYDVGTPCSSLSPGSCLPSPLTLPRSPSPPPSTADFTEFLHASNSTLFEKDFSNLTLSDREQRELYEAAKVIQKAYRSYKGRKKSEQDRERHAAVLIQNCYRRYKQFAYFKQMTRAAMVIQNGYRSYCESKRFKKTEEVTMGTHSSNGCRLLDNSSGSTLKRTFSQRRQNQAARKIQQFMRQSKNKLARERAEREKLAPCRVSHPN